MWYLVLSHLTEPESPDEEDMEDERTEEGGVNLPSREHHVEFPASTK